MSEYIVVPRERAGIELDEFLCLWFPEWNKGFVRRQVRAGKVLVDGAPAQPSQILRVDQVLILDIDADDEPQPPRSQPGVTLELLYEDDDVLVVQKPAGLAVEPERWARDRGSVAGGLLQLALDRARVAREPDPGLAEFDPLGVHGEADGDESPVDGDTERLALEMRPRIVHRLDKDTTGALLVAKHLEAERALRSAFESGSVGKRYLALVEGEHPLADGESEIIDLPLGPNARRSGAMRVHAEGKPSRTRVWVEERFRGYTLMGCEPLTGRTHQIRVHLSHVGFPLVVDPLYGRNDTLLLSSFKPNYRAKRGRPERPLMGRLTLHAAGLDLPSPSDPERRIVVEAPLPKDFTVTLKKLSKYRSPRT